MQRTLADLPFIFIIGFNKSATTALHLLFRKNGFPCVHWDYGDLARTMLQNCCSDLPILTGYDKEFRVFSDMTFRTHRLRFEANSLFRVLDADYPNSFFVYNSRNIQDWLRSRALHKGYDKESLIQFEMRLLKTLDPQKVLDKWRREREQFEEEMRDYFYGSSRFIEIDISDVALPVTLSRFLGMPLDASHWQTHNRNPQTA
jgi:hypothetical protein